MHLSPITSFVLFTLLVSGFSVGLEAQEPEADSKKLPVSIAEKANDGFKPPPPLDNVVVLEEVVVTATRVEGGGRRRSTAAGRKELDSSDQTDMDGFFDDIDGLSTLGGDDEGNSFSINGLSPDLSKVTLDGQGFGEGRGNGGMGAGDLSPDMILRVDVYRTPAAYMEEGGSGGLVNLQMRNPLDIPRPSTSIRAKLGYVPDKGNFSPSANLFLGRPSDNKKFGYMLSLNLDDRTRQYGSQIISSWDLQQFDGRPAFIPNQVRSDAVKIDERRVLANLTLGFRPHRSLDINGKLFLSQRYKDTESDSLQHRL
jgi:outer membrane receptor for ferrienterochelin and colicin